MKLLIQLFFCLFLVNTIYGQKSAVTINWLTPNNLSISESTINVEGATPFFVDESSFTAELISSWPKKTANYSGAKAIDVILENVSASFSSNIDKNGLPKNFKVEMMYQQGLHRFWLKVNGNVLRLMLLEFTR